MMIYNFVRSKEAEQFKNGNKRPHPFDAYCPSMQEKLDKCVCSDCGIQWPCAAAVKRHKVFHDSEHFETRDYAIWEEVEDELLNDIDYNVDEVMSESDVNVEDMPIISVKDLKSPFVEIYE